MNYALALPLPLLFLAASSGLGKRFRNPNRLVTSTDPVGILVADLNGDGRLDIVATYEPSIGQSMVQVFLAQPGGSYSVTSVQPLPTGVTPYCQVADETRDGKPDLICPYADQFNASLMVFPGNGDGTFGTPIETALPSSEQFDVYWAPVVRCWAK